MYGGRLASRRSCIQFQQGAAAWFNHTTATPPIEGLYNARDWFGLPESETSRLIIDKEALRLKSKFEKRSVSLADKIKNRCHLYATYTSPSTPCPDAAGDIFGSFEYFQERSPGLANVIIRRRRVDASDGGTEVVINVNKLSERLPQPVSLLYLRPSVSQRYVAFILEVGAESKKMLYIKDMGQMAVCEISFDGPESVHGYISKFEWGRSADNDAIYFVFDKDLLRPRTVYRYVLEEQRLFRLNRFRALNLARSRMKCIFDEKDSSCFVDIYRTKDDKHMIINSNNKTSSEAFLLEEAEEGFQRRLFCRRRRGLQYYLTHCNNQFYAISNLKAALGRCAYTEDAIMTDHSISLYRCDGITWDRDASTEEIGHPSRWTKIWPSNTSVPIQDKSTNPFNVDSNASAAVLAVEDVDFFRKLAVLYGRKRGIATISKVDLETGEELDFMPELIEEIGGCNFDLSPSSNDHNECQLRFDLSSPLVPGVTGEINLSGLTSTHVKWSNRIDIPGVPTLNRDDFHIEYMMVPMHSGDVSKCSFGHVPVTILSKGKLSRPAPTPLLLIGYGSYGVSLPMSYRPELMVLLEKGWIIAFAHVRGGGELGKEWYHTGRQENKWNTFQDFASCAKYLIDQSYTAPQLLCAEFESAGGLIGGVMINKYPHLFGGMILRNPFLDIYNTIQDPHQPLTAHEYDEWGNPECSQQLQYIKSYCPYTNIGSQAAEHYYDSDEEISRPLIYVSIGLHDSNVAPWETLRWVSRLRNHRLQHVLSHNKRNDQTETGKRNTPLLGETTAGDDAFDFDELDSSGVLLRIIEDSGHSGPRCLEDRYKERSYELAFLETAAAQSVTKR